MSYGIGALDTVRWVGVNNYTGLLHDPDFWNALRNTMIFVIAGGPLSVAVSLGAALLLNAKAGTLQTVLSHGVLRAGRDHARGRRDRMALSLSPALRPLESGDSARSASVRSTGSEIRTSRWPR
jgi:hypothetical protein